MSDKEEVLKAIVDNYINDIRDQILLNLKEKNELLWHVPDHLSLRHVPDHLKTYEICKMAVECCSRNLQYVPDRLKEAIEGHKKMVKKYLKEVKT